jgi:hypothetical protein
MIRSRLLFFALLLAGLLLGGCQSSKPPSPLDQPLVARFYMEVRQGTPGIVAQLPISKVTLNVAAKPVLVESDIVKVDFAKVDPLGWCLHFEFTPTAARDLYRLSTANIGGRLMIALNETPIGVRRIDAPLADGTLLIFIEVPNEELPPIAERLKRTLHLDEKKKAR